MEKIINSAKQGEVDVMAAFNNKFYSLNPDGLSPAYNIIFANTSSINLEQAIIDDIVEVLTFQESAVEQ